MSAASAMSVKRLSKILVSVILAFSVSFTPLAAYIPFNGAAPITAYAGPGNIKAGQVDCAYICDVLGILRGEGDGVTDEYLAKETQRVQAAYLTLRLVGKESEAENFTGTNNFNDVGHIYEGGQRRTAYLKAHSSEYGWEGDGQNNLMPNQNVTAQQFYKVLLTVLGYQANVDYPYEDTLLYANQVAGMRECSKISVPLKNDDIAVMLVEALLAYIRDETYTLAEYLVEEGVVDLDKAIEMGVISRTDIIDVVTEPEPDDTEPEAPAASYLQVESITATNFAEIDILFNTKVDEDSIDRNYISIKGSPLLSTDNVRLLEDGVTVRIYREAGFVTQQGQTVTVSVSKVRIAGGTAETAPVKDREITIVDNTTPSLVAVEAIGLRRVRLEFSEPIRTTDSAFRNYTIYKFNGRALPLSDAVVCNGREIYLNFSTPLENGPNKLSIDINRLFDLAGFPIYNVVDFEFDATPDLEPPQVLTIDAWREKVVVTFTKEVRDQIKLYWLDGSYKRYSQAGVKDPYKREKMTFTFAENSYLPINETTVVLENIIDMNNNQAPEYRTTLLPHFDADRPVVVIVESEAENEIAVGFSKPIKIGTTNGGRFVLKDSYNITVPLTISPYTPSGAYTADPRYIKLTGDIPAGTYSLTVRDVEDTTAQVNKVAESTHTVIVTDKTPPRVVGVSANIPASKVVIIFNKELDWGTASDRTSYQYFLPGRGHVDVPSDTYVTLENDMKTVVVTFPQNGWDVGGGVNVANAFMQYIATAGADEMRVVNVKDVAGNEILPTLVDVPATNEAAAKLLQSAYAVTPNRIMMKFDATGSLPINTGSQDFNMRAGAQNLYFKSLGYDSIDAEKRELYFDFDFDLNADGTYGAAHTPVTISMVAPNQVNYTKTALGTPTEILNGATVTVTDNIKTGMQEAYRGNRAAGAAQNSANVSCPSVTRDQMLIVFDEPVDFLAISSIAQLNNLVDVMLVSSPNSPISRSQYMVDAYDANAAKITALGSVTTRMIVVTLASSTNQAVNVSIRASSLWDGNYDCNGWEIVNNAFETDFLGPVS